MADMTMIEGIAMLKTIRRPSSKHGIILLAFLWLAAAIPATADSNVYSAYDTNGDSYLDRSEFGQFLKKRRIKSSYQHIWKFEKVDSDHDGVISNDELVSALQKEVKLRLQLRGD